jgi:hypothetical protein
MIEFARTLFSEFELTSQMHQRQLVEVERQRAEHVVRRMEAELAHVGPGLA